MGVTLNDRVYRITQIKIDKDGYKVALRNLQTGKEAIATVKWDIVDRKIWHKFRSWGQW
jgi:hypothetical protein